MKEILAGEGFHNAIKDLNLNAKRTYHGKWYEVWEMPDAEFNKLINLTGDEAYDILDPNKNWKDEWGWWRYSDGSILENNSKCPVLEFTVRDQPMRGYLNGSRYDDFMGEFSEDRDDSWYFTCTNLTEYIESEFGATNEKNVCAIAKSLAKLNNISMGELFKKYERDEINED